MRVVNISIHAPLAGCDVIKRLMNYGYGISIHAPLAGCDKNRLIYIRCREKFQSTHPLRGATGILIIIACRV